MDARRSFSTRVVFFDAAGTLIRLARSVGWHYRQAAIKHGGDFSEADLNREFGLAWKTHEPPVETRRKRLDDDKDWWRALVWRVLDGVGAGESLDRAACFETLYAEFARPGVWELFPEAPAVLDALSAKYELGIISNFDGRLRTVLRDLGVADRFRHWVISSEVGADKPSPWPFQRALEMAGVAADEAMHVGDSPVEDWDAASAAGMQVLRLHRPENSLASLIAVLGARTQ